MDNMCKAKFSNTADSKSRTLFGFLKTSGKNLFGKIMSSSFKTKTANLVKHIFSNGASSEKMICQYLDGTKIDQLSIESNVIYGRKVVAF